MLKAVDRNPTRPKRTDAIGVPYGLKSTNAHIHVLEALTALSRVDKREIVKERLREVFLIFRDRLIAEQGALYVQLTRIGGRPRRRSPLGTTSKPPISWWRPPMPWVLPTIPVPGRVPACWSIMPIKWGWDAENGGFYDKAKTFNAKAFDQTKVWWTEAEAFNTLLLMHWKYGNRTEVYWTAFVNVWEFIENHLLDPVHGGWYTQTTHNGRLIGDDGKANQWKANYHVTCVDQCGEAAGYVRSPPHPMSSKPVGLM